jgi:hypothetical protein
LHRSLLGYGLAAAAMLFAPGLASATDTLLAGKRLVIDNRVPDDERRNKIIISARSEDLGIGVPGSTGDPTCDGAGGGGARLTVTSVATGASHTTELPCQNWTGRKTGSWRYYDRKLEVSTCTTVQIRSTRTLRATCLGRGPTDLDFDLVPGAAAGPIDVTLELGTGPDRYCLRFGGTVKHDGSDGKKFFARDSAAPGACASTGS